MKPSTKRLAYVFALIALAGGIYAVAQPSAKQTVQVTLTYPTNSASIPITMPKGTQFSVTLPSNPTTGYSWQLGSTLNQSIVKNNGNKFVPPVATNPPVVGQGGKTVWSFTAVGRGRQTIVLNYVRPWEKKTAPAQVQTFTVTVQ